MKSRHSLSVISRHRSSSIARCKSDRTIYSQLSGPVGLCSEPVDDTIPPPAITAVAPVEPVIEPPLDLKASDVIVLSAVEADDGFTPSRLISAEEGFFFFPEPGAVVPPDNMS